MATNRREAVENGKREGREIAARSEPVKCNAEDTDRRKSKTAKDGPGWWNPALTPNHACGGRERAALVKVKFDRDVRLSLSTDHTSRMDLFICFSKAYNRILFSLYQGAPALNPNRITLQPKTNQKRKRLQ